MKTVIIFVTALLITLGTIWITPPTDERAMYGMEGPIEQNWLPRKVAGWPAPFLADNPNTSVPHNVGPEDNFRPGPFAATLSFWLLVLIGLRRLGRHLINQHRA